MEGSYNPILAEPSVRQKMRTSEGQQVGAINHRAALAPLLPFQLLPDHQHFEQALALSIKPLPTERLPMLDEDLRFAASFAAVRSSPQTQQTQEMRSGSPFGLQSALASRHRALEAEATVGDHAAAANGRCDVAGYAGASRYGLHSTLWYLPRAGGCKVSEQEYGSDQCCCARREPARRTKALSCLGQVETQYEAEEGKASAS